MKKLIPSLTLIIRIATCLLVIFLTLFMLAPFLASYRTFQEMGLLRETTENPFLFSQIEWTSQIIKANPVSQSTFIYILAIVTSLFMTIIMLAIKAYRTRQEFLLAQKEKQMKQQEVNEFLDEQQFKSLRAMLEAQEKERNRIAQELHDHLGSLLSMAKLHFLAADRQMEDLRQQSQEQYARLPIC